MEHEQFGGRIGWYHWESQPLAAGARGAARCAEIEVGGTAGVDVEATMGDLTASQ
jgi:hypothetical protein